MTKLNEGVDRLKEGIRRVALAGVGAAVLAKEGAVDAARRWVKRGEQVEPDLKKTWGRFAKTQEQVAEKTGSTFKKAWGFLPLVTKRDILDLSKRIDALATRVGGGPRKKAK